MYKKPLTLLVCFALVISAFCQEDYIIGGSSFVKAKGVYFMGMSTVERDALSSIGLMMYDNVADKYSYRNTLVWKNLSVEGHVHVPADVGLSNVSNTSDANKPVSTATQTALDLKATIASPTFTGTVAGITKTMVGLGSADNTSDVGKPVSTAQQTALDLKTNLTSLSAYSTLLEASGSHTAAKVAGTYALCDGDPVAVSGTGVLYPIKTLYIASADYPTINGLAPKLRIRAQLFVNDVAPTGNFTFGLYPVTRPGTSGGAGLNIYTLGTVVSGSNGATFTTPAADGMLNAVSSDFALPADGPYVIGIITTATVAASSHVNMVAYLQIRNN